MLKISWQIICKSQDQIALERFPEMLSHGVKMQKVAEVYLFYWRVYYLEENVNSSKKQ